MVYSLGYRRPTHVSRASSSSATSFLNLDKEQQASRTGSASTTNGIPEALSFDKIINDGTCSPCTARDLLNYLLYIEHSAENFQFFLWFRDYERRFNEAKTVDIALAPVWTQKQQESALQAAQIEASAHKATIESPAAAKGIFKGTDFETPGIVTISECNDPFLTPPCTPNSRSISVQSHQTNGSERDSEYQVSNVDSYRQVSGKAFKSVGLEQPFTVQPFRQEIDRVIATYISEKAPRELNLSGRERTVVLKALHYTTHPSALRAVFNSAEHTLRRQAHPNFIRWTICNGNRPRVVFARGLGVFLIMASLAVAIVLTLSAAGRGWRALPALGFVLGICTLIMAWKGLCVVLHSMHSRHVRPWELFEDPEGSVDMKKSFETFDSSNSYEDAPWHIQYQKRNILRKILDRQTWVQEPALRQIQDTIFIQSLLAAVLASAVLTAIFIAVPGGNYF